MNVDIFTGEEIDERADWVKEWTDMPEFDSTIEEEYCKITVRFATKEDFNSFCDKIGSKISFKKYNKKSIWFPNKDSTDIFDRYF